MIESQPTASRPRNPRPTGRRLKASRREREPVTTVRHVSAVTIKDNSLAALLALPHPVATHPVVVPPPPPPVVVTHDGPLLEMQLPPPRPVAESIPESAVTHPLPHPLPALSAPPTALPVFSLPTAAESEVPAATITAARSYAPPTPLHARSVELSVVAVLSVLITLAFSFTAQRAAHWGEARAKITPSLHSEAATAPPAFGVSPNPVQVATLSASIPVVPLRQLPVQGGGAGSRGSGALAAQASGSGANRGELVRALAGVASAARSCGPGPVQTQVVATFGPSGLPSDVHFGGGAPPRALRSCVLRAVSRARITPFSGAPVTVSKNLSW